MESGGAEISLEALFAIANALHTSVDGLLFGRASGEAELMALLRDASPGEREVLLEAAREAKESYRKRR